VRLGAGAREGHPASAQERGAGQLATLVQALEKTPTTTAALRGTPAGRGGRGTPLESGGECGDEKQGRGGASLKASRSGKALRLAGFPGICSPCWEPSPCKWPSRKTRIKGLLARKKALTESSRPQGPSQARLALIESSQLLM